jgi:hypothetical protein
MHLIEQVLGRQFTRVEGSDPYIRVGTVAVYVGGHEFVIPVAISIVSRR